MNVIKPPFGPAESAATRRASVTTDRQRPPHTNTGPAVESDVSLREVHQLYTAVGAERAARVQQLKEQVNSGSYRPNLEIVAERLMAEFGVGLG